MALVSEPFDIVISFDTTGSMYRCLDIVKRRMRSMMKNLKASIPGIHLGVIAHGDYDTGHVYVIKYKNLTDNVEALCRFVNEAEKTGTGKPHRNFDEAYELSLYYANTKIRWRPNSTRTLIMIGDHRPHEKNYILNKQHIDWREEILDLREMNVKIYAVQCEANQEADSFFHKIASTTFGHHVVLTDFDKVEEVLMSICYREAGLGLECSEDIAVLKSPTESHEPVSDNNVPDELFDVSSDESDEDEKGMVCPLCKTSKPTNEFPITTVTDDCHHAPLECLRCVIKYANENGKCPNINCNALVDSNNKMVQIFQAKLDRMFVDYRKVMEERAKLLRPQGNVISVSTITGDTEWIPFVPTMRIDDIRNEVQERLNLPKDQQRLIFNDTNLKPDMRLSDYNIGCSDNISLILPLYCIPEHLDHVVFDLSWEFPSSNPDFLDATCMAFDGTDFVQVIDWNHPTNKYYLRNSVKHSEQNLTGPGAKTGHQTIHVYLKSVPRNITYLYFILSSWRSPNLSAFKNPSLKFYEASDENVNLCETTFTHALSSQAVIMCSVVRTGLKWQIFECNTGSLVSGNAKQYNPIRTRIEELIRSEI